MAGEEPGSPNTDEQGKVWHLLFGDIVPTGHPNIDLVLQKGKYFFTA